MQSWGDSSRFYHRGTRREPTKSGVVGLLAAALGRRRTDPVEDLAGLRFGVRVDQVGVVETDFQTATDWERGSTKPLTHRDYLADARFLVALEGPDELLDGLAAAIRRPVFPIYLGRRAFAPTGRVVLGTSDAPLARALEEADWLAADWYRRRQPETVRLAVSRDAEPGETADETIADVPVSFDPRNRVHALRRVVHGWTEVANDLPAVTGRVSDHDPMLLTGGE